MCSDAHVSCKGFAVDNGPEHHALKDVISYCKEFKILCQCLTF